MSVYFYSPGYDTDRITGFEKRIRAAIPDLIRINQIEEIKTRGTELKNDSDYLLIVSFTVDRNDLSGFVAAATRDTRNVFTILISDDISATDYKRLIRTGYADWASASTAPQEIVDIISRRRGDATPRAEGSFPVIASFVPCAGGVGNTMLAVEVAASLKINKATAGRNICIIDLDFQTSHVCDYLDIEPRLQIEEISNNPERLDEQLLDIYVSRHVCGLHVFAAPRTRLNVCDLNLSALDALFNVMSSRYDLVIIDFPANWYAWTLQIIAGSDGFIVTGVNTIPGLRQMVETMAAIRKVRHPSAYMAAALNRCERGLLGGVARRHHVNKVLGQEKIFYVRDEPLVLESINAGTPMALTRTARRTSREIASIAGFCAELKSVRGVAPRPHRGS